ncbi:MAG: site-2 protease family protein [Anaerolineae bacterium]|nr:site-2 protease family protein [Anaerolineae bacterium]
MNPESTVPEPLDPSRLETIGQLRAALIGIMDGVETLRAPAPEEGAPPSRRTRLRPTLAFRGRLIVDPVEGYKELRARFAPLGYTPMLDRQGEYEIVTAIPAVFAQSSPKRWWLNALLLLVTVVTTIVSGALMEQSELIAARMEQVTDQSALLLEVVRVFAEEPRRLLSGVPASLTIMGILGLHELAHYAAARRHKLDSSLPFFIPAPFGFGTFGAIIRMRTPWEDRNALFDVGVAGPIAGILVALPLFFLGLMRSPAMAPLPGGTPLGTPLLLSWMEDLVYVLRGIPASYDIYVNSWTFAAWFGVVVSGFNLLPIGQLDGGHVAYALLGRHTSKLSTAVLVALAGLAWLWPGWIAWIAFTFLSGWMHPPPLNALAPLSGWRVALGIGVWILTALIFTPVPFPTG